MGISIEFLILIRVFGNLYEIASESFVFDKFFLQESTLFISVNKRGTYECEQVPTITQKMLN